MAPKKKPENPIFKQVTYVVQPAFFASVDDDRLAGISGFGKTAREAINSLRAEVKRRYPSEIYEVTELAANVELWTATSWREPVYTEL